MPGSPFGRGAEAHAPSYSKPILRSTRYSTISPFSTPAVDLTTSIVRMFRTVRDAVATACRAASLHEVGLVPTISRMMITPIRALRAPIPAGLRSSATRDGSLGEREAPARAPHYGAGAGGRGGRRGGGRRNG